MKQVSTGKEGDHCAPTKPPQSSRCQLGHRIGLGTGFRFFKVFGLNKIEVIQHTNPDNAGQHVEIVAEEMEFIHGLFSYLFIIKAD